MASGETISRSVNGMQILVLTIIEILIARVERKLEPRLNSQRIAMSRVPVILPEEAITGVMTVENRGSACKESRQASYCLKNGAAPRNSPSTSRCQVSPKLDCHKLCRVAFKAVFFRKKRGGCKIAAVFSNSKTHIPSHQQIRRLGRYRRTAQRV